MMGTGRWGQNLVRVVDGLGDAAVSWIVDPDPSNLAAAHLLAPSAHLVPRIEETGFDFDAVVIATPVKDHEAHAASLLRRDKHVFIEKPASLDLESAKRLHAQSRARQLTLMVGHQLRFHPGFETLVNAHRAGKIGTLHRIRSARSSLIDMTKEPGVVWALGPHDLAMILHITGAVPDRTSCIYSPKQAIWRASHAEIKLQYDNGVDAVVTLFSSSTERVRRFTLFGDEGRLEFNDADAPGKVTFYPHSGTPESLPFAVFEPLQREMQHFISSIVHAREPLTGGKHLIDVTEILSKCI
jgi:predicted dehydrogenase